MARKLLKATVPCPPPCWTYASPSKLPGILVVTGGYAAAVALVVVVASANVHTGGPVWWPGRINRCRRKVGRHLRFITSPETYVRPPLAALSVCFAKLLPFVTVEVVRVRLTRCGPMISAWTVHLATCRMPLRLYCDMVVACVSQDLFPVSGTVSATRSTPFYYRNHVLK